MMGLEAKSEDEHMVIVMVREFTITAVIILLVSQPKTCEQLNTALGFDGLFPVLLCLFCSVSVLVLLSLEIYDH